jgi:hypothetical protein
MYVDNYALGGPSCTIASFINSDTGTGPEIPATQQSFNSSIYFKNEQ